VVLVLITLAAGFLRLVALDTFPPGLYHDEAYNGLDALQVLQGQTPIFFEANNGREPLFIYLAAASIAALGRSPGALRLVSAIVGTLTVPAFYWLGRELYGRRVATLAAVLATGTVWTLNLSRVAFRAVTMPPLQALALALLWRGLSRRRLGNMAWAGAIYGLSFYTYLAARFSVLALFLFVVYTLLWHRQSFWLRGWALFALLSLVVVAPLGYYLITHWQSTFGRAAQVSILNPQINGGNLWGFLVRQTWRALRSFNFRGDFIPRHNVPLRPAFEAFSGLAFLLGVAISLKRARRLPAYALSLIWLGMMLLPTILAEGAPHMLRASGVLPAVFLFPALGLDELRQAMAQRRLANASLVLVWGVLAISSVASVTDYARHLRSEAVYYNFESGAVQMAAEVNRFLGRGWQGTGLAARQDVPEPARRVFMAPGLWHNWASVRYLCPASGALAILPEGATDLPGTQDDADVLLVLWPFEDNRAALSLLPRNRLISAHEGANERGDLERESRLLYIALRTEPPEVAPRSVDAAWEGGIRLLGCHLTVQEGGKLLAKLYWQAMQPIARNYTVFCHIVCNGARIGQHDGPPASGYYPSELWRPGDIIEDNHLVTLSSPYDGRTCQVVVGLYQLETMERLALVDKAGQRTADTSIVLGEPTGP
jgi:4-amino-4-deoxy-L-arabinose transferase-like glycosyltransferase